MKLKYIRVCGFQSFGVKPVTIDLESLTFLIGPNGSGKTATLQALCRLFSFDPNQRRLRRSDFFVPHDEEDVPAERALWIEADFHFPELTDGGNEHPTIPCHFGHMRLDDLDGVPRVRYRLDASIGLEDEIEQSLRYVLDVDESGIPIETVPVPRDERTQIQVHYLPARRDPAEHITYGANALLGRLLRAVNWTDQREKISQLTTDISQSLRDNRSVVSLGAGITNAWKALHKGKFFKDPSLTFVATEIESLLRHLSVSFTPGHGEQQVDFSRLSDGQKSMLYLTLVLSSQAIGRSVLGGDDESFDIEKLRPAVFTIIALEEPENSLSPHYLGRIVSSLKTLVGDPHAFDAQALIATHAPSMLRRVEPTDIRYLRLDDARCTVVSTITMPPDTKGESYKFVREAVQAFPELYFSRLVILGEGDSEEIVLPRLLAAKRLMVDEAAVTIAPLGGRHVNHFWRLLSGLNIPYVTLLDLDVGRHGGGWGRIKYVATELMKHRPTVAYLTEDQVSKLPKWDNPTYPLLDVEKNPQYKNYVQDLEPLGVFFSSPMDLDFSMLVAFPKAFGLSPTDLALPKVNQVKSVLGESCFKPTQYTPLQRKHFIAYHKLFKLDSKPKSHLEALSKLTDEELLKAMPASLSRLVDHVIMRVEALHE
ncbi:MULTISPECIES: AAA family ATPase [Pseudomonas]|uniref:AAA family ATPase n=1 Tax=Pseudomonas TaxID=286 RepID=UPI00049B1FF5|nr:MULTISPECIES: AAA family ATPase [Pseudomonas]AHZ80373.1 chromosome segregation protein SMC [Pseudomonas putida]MCK2124535.1 AAA family ATPase [Pseudomonas sp. PNPG3]QUN70414.1 AAA family ATPase [Pseudomonas sp. JS425]